MTLILGMLSALLGTGTVDTASVQDVQIFVTAYQVGASGAEKPAGVSRGTGPLSIGAPTVGVFSMFGCGGFSLTVPPHSFRDDATVGWRVEVTPLKVVDHAVTFRLRWVRALDTGQGLSQASEDVEVTLRPGESRPLDSVEVVEDGATTSKSRSCDTKAVSLRVSADFPVLDRRLIGADVWLVEHLPNGKEQSRLQSVRGLPHRPIPFYFDSVLHDRGRLDVFGKLVVDLEQGILGITLETAGAWADPGQTGYQSAQWFRSTVDIKPDEIVDVALKQPDDKTGGLGGRTFSIRIRARQIR